MMFLFLGITKVFMTHKHLSDAKNLTTSCQANLIPWGFHTSWMVIWTANKYHKFPEWSGRFWRHLDPWTQGTFSTFDEDLHHFGVWYGLGPKDVGWWIAKKDATTAVHLSDLHRGFSDFWSWLPWETRILSDRPKTSGSTYLFGENADLCRDV